MKRYWVGLALAFLAAAGSARAEFSLSQAGVDDRMAVVFKPGVSAEEQRKLVDSFGLEVMREWGTLNALVVRPKAGRVAPTAVRLKAEPAVYDVARDFWTKWIETNATLQQSPLPALDSVMKQLHKLRKDVGQSQEPQWGVRRVNAPASWPTNKGRGIKVGIVDTGIDPNHPELSARVKGGHNSIDKDQPWHDDHFHGTHVGGIVAATLNGEGVVGVAPEADLYAVKVLTKEGSGSLFGIVDGIMWCVQNGMQVVNMSLGAAQGNFLFEMAVNQLKSADIPLIAAAGNDGKAVNFPAAYPAAIAVSALDEADGIASFSSRGPEIAFIAPGVKIPSTITGGGIKAYSGTSMATPHVTGLAALAVANGARGQDGVRSALQKAAVKLNGLPPTEQGAGVIDAGRLR